jgi:hypothetical protein
MKAIELKRGKNMHDDYIDEFLQNIIEMKELNYEIYEN